MLVYWGVPGAGFAWSKSCRAGTARMGACVHRVQPWAAREGDGMPWATAPKLVPPNGLPSGAVPQIAFITAAPRPGSHLHLWDHVPALEHPALQVWVVGADARVDVAHPDLLPPGGGVPGQGRGHGGVVPLHPEQRVVGLPVDGHPVVGLRKLKGCRARAGRAGGGGGSGSGGGGVGAQIEQGS